MKKIEANPDKRKPGGQPGHQGKTRKGFGRVDRYEILRPQMCLACGQTEFTTEPFLKSSLNVSNVSFNDIPDVITNVKLLEGMTEEEKESFLTNTFKANAIDYYSFWKLSVGLSNLAFYGKDREYALGNTDKQKDMGQWSSLFGSVNQLYVTDNP